MTSLYGTRYPLVTVQLTEQYTSYRVQWPTVGYIQSQLEKIGTVLVL